VEPWCWGQANGGCIGPGGLFCSQWFEKGEVICFPGVDIGTRRAFQEEGYPRKSSLAWKVFVFFKAGFELLGKLDPVGRIPSICLNVH
jgi:hypothetical protein